MAQTTGIVLFSGIWKEQSKDDFSLLHDFWNLGWKTQKLSPTWQVGTRHLYLINSHVGWLEAPETGTAN